MKAPRKMSYSTSKLLQNCEVEYMHSKIWETKPDEDFEETDAFGFGKAFHEVLEKSKHNAFHKEHLLDAMETHKVNIADLGPLMAMGKRYLQLHKLSGLKVVHCEQEISTPEYIGFIDMILVDENGGWWIGDLKTTSRFDEKNLLPRMAFDDQLNLYTYFFKWLAPLYDLDPMKFKGCRYRATTKPKIVQKGKETPEEYADRVADKVEVYDIEVPLSVMDPQSAWDSIVKSYERSVILQGGEDAPKRNLNGCINYFRPCKFFSKCHGELFSKNGDKVHVHTITSYTESEDAL